MADNDSDSAVVVGAIVAKEIALIGLHLWMENARRAGMDAQQRAEYIAKADADFEARQEIEPPPWLTGEGEGEDDA